MLLNLERFPFSAYIASESEREVREGAEVVKAQIRREPKTERSYWFGKEHAAEIAPVPSLDLPNLFLLFFCAPILSPTPAQPSATLKENHRSTLPHRQYVQGEGQLSARCQILNCNCFCGRSRATRVTNFLAHSIVAINIYVPGPLQFHFASAMYYVSI